MCSTTLPLGQSWLLSWHKHLFNYMPESQNWAGLTVRRTTMSSEMQSQTSQGSYRYDVYMWCSRNVRSNMYMLIYWSTFLKITQNGIILYILFCVFFAFNIPWLYIHTCQHKQTPFFLMPIYYPNLKIPSLD